MAENPVPYANLPAVFCVEMVKNGRSGYAFINSTLQAIAAIGNEGLQGNVCILKEKAHLNRYFRIINNTTYILEHQSTWNRVLTRKGSGIVNRPTQWRNTGTALQNQNIDYPVLRFRAHSTVMPTINTRAFIPKIDQLPEVPAPVQNVATVPPPLDTDKLYEISTIPQHAIRALLRDAAMQEEVCAITGEEVDVANGAVTSCFHIFEKNAITQWMNMPNSRDKCPVCNTKCDVYLLD